MTEVFAQAEVPEVIGVDSFIARGGAEVLFSYVLVADNTFQAKRIDAVGNFKIDGVFRTARQIFVAFGVFGVEVVIAGTDIKVVGQLCRQLKLDPSQAGFVYVAGLIDAELPTRAGITDPFVGDQIFDVIMKVKTLAVMWSLKYSTPAS